MNFHITSNLHSYKLNIIYYLEFYQYHVEVVSITLSDQRQSYPSTPHLAVTP